MEALLTAPFLGGNKTVFLRQAPYFDPLSEPGRFASVKAEVERLVNLLKKGLPAGVSFVLLTRKVNKATTFFKTFQSRGEVHAFDEPEKDSEIKADYIPLVKKLVAERQLTMEDGVLAAFLDRAGYNLRQAANELDKLDLYLGDRRAVTREDIELMVAPVRAGKFWNLKPLLRPARQTLQPCTACWRGRGTRAARVLQRPRDIVADCLKRGWLQVPAAIGRADVERPARRKNCCPLLANATRAGNHMGKMAAQAQRLPPSRWFRWLNAAVDAQAAMTGGDNVPPATTLEVFTTRTLGELTAPK